MANDKATRRSTSLYKACYKSPLTLAIMSEDIKVMGELLCAGADTSELSYFRGHGEAPLLTAVRYAREDMVTVLLSHGANVNQASNRGHTALLRAAQRNYNTILSQLLSHNADANGTDAMGRSPLFWTVKLRNMEATRELIGYGADVNLRSPKTSILHTAVAVDFAEVTKLLLSEGARVDTRDEYDETPLFAAIRVDNMEIVLALLEHGADINVVNHDFRSPLHLSAASVHNNVDLTQLLLDNGASVNALDRYRNTPLVLSLRNYILRPNYSVTKCLMQHGSELQDENCASALEWAVEAHANFNVVRFAVKAGFRLTGQRWVQELVNGDSNRRRWISAGSDLTQERLFVEFIRERLRNASSLVQLCRSSIREHLIHTGCIGSIYNAIRQLPLPEIIKLFLMMEDED